MKKYIYSFLVFLLGIQMPIMAAWNFQFQCASGQTLYCKILTDSTVAVTYPGYLHSMYDRFYDGYTRPSGALIFPAKVQNNENEYFVTEITDYAFVNCSFSSLTFEENSKLRKIGMSAFQKNNLSGDLTFPNSLKSLGYSAFLGNRLSSVTIPENCTSVGEAAFWNNSYLETFTINARNLTYMGNANSPGFVQGVGNLTTVNIGEYVTNIPQYAFAYTTSISQVNCYALTPPTLYATSFVNVTPYARVKVPCESLDAYNNDGFWSQFVDVKGLDDCTTQKIQITVTSSDLAKGSVSGSGKYDYGTQVTVEAFPNSGYKFLQWSDGTKYNPYRFTALEDVTLEALFGDLNEDLQDSDTRTIPSKTLRNGQILILRGDKTFNALGTEVK